MQIQGNDPVIDKLLKGQDEIVFNLVHLIRGAKGARLFSDGTHYLIAQGSASAPLWLYVSANLSGQAEREVFEILSKAKEETGCLSINAQEKYAQEMLIRFAQENGLNLFKRDPLNAYFIREVRSVAPVGKIISSVGHEETIAMLIQEAAIDDNDGELTCEQAMQFAKAHAASGDLFLWEDGLVASMARVVRYGRYARLTSIVTERAQRGKGYAKMLVGELAKRLLLEGLTPVLYARSENPSSTRCYQSIGFEKAGEITEFKFLK